MKTLIKNGRIETTVDDYKFDLWQLLCTEIMLNLSKVNELIAALDKDWRPIGDRLIMNKTFELLRHRI